MLRFYAIGVKRSTGTLYKTNHPTSHGTKRAKKREYPENVAKRKTILASQNVAKSLTFIKMAKFLILRIALYPDDELKAAIFISGSEHSGNFARIDTQFICILV